MKLKWKILTWILHDNERYARITKLSKNEYMLERWIAANYSESFANLSKFSEAKESGRIWVEEGKII